jgi:hypothetical protein
MQLMALGIGRLLMQFFKATSLSRLATVAAVFAFSTILSASLPWAGGAPIEGTIALADAVKAFNSNAANDPIGVAEPLLTVDEVIAAIRAINRSDYPHMSDGVYYALQDVAATSMLPANAKLNFTTGWKTKNYYYKVWWVDLSIMTGDKTGYTHRLRDRKISSSPLAGSAD